VRWFAKYEGRSIDLKSAAIAHLRGEPSKGNHTAAVKGEIELQEEAVSKAGDLVGQLFKAWNNANLVAYHAHTVEATKAFVQAEDHPFLRQFCARHPLYRQLDAFTPPLFTKDHLRGHADSILNARNLEAIWEHLQVNAEGYQDWKFRSTTLGSTKSRTPRLPPITPRRKRKRKHFSIRVTWIC
jgi:hypothetical protein